MSGFAVLIQKTAEKWKKKKRERRGSEAHVLFVIGVNKTSHNA